MNEGKPDNILRATLAINPEEAYNGGERTLTLPGGRQITLRIPPRAYNGQELLLSGQGEASATGPAGDLIITLIVTTERVVHKGDQTEDPNAATFIKSNFLSQPQANPPEPARNVSTSYPNMTSSPSYSSPTPPAPPPPSTSQMPPYYQLPATPLPERPEPARRNRSALLILVALALLVLLGGGALAYVTVIAPNVGGTNPTATARNNATGTAQAQRTATAAALATSQANATATSASINNATATAIAPQMNDYKQVTSRTPSLNDSMQKQSATSWYTGDNCFFQNNAFHVTSTQTAYFNYCSSTKATYENFAFQAHATIVKGDYAGFIFRANDSYNQYYLFIFNSTGHFELYFYDKNSSSKSVIIQRSTSDLLKKGAGQENIICIIARGNNFAIYFNGQYAKTFTDALSRLSSGHLGFVALDDTHATEVTYTQTQIWKL